MSDDFGDQINVGEVAPYAASAYGAYKTYNRMAPFIQGTIDSAQGLGLGSAAARLTTHAVTGTMGPSVRAAVGGIGRAAVTRAAVGLGVRAGVGAGVSAASGAAAGASAGSIVPGIGTLAGAAIGAALPLIIPHTPIAGIVRNIPLIGGFLSPKPPPKPKIVKGGLVGVKPQTGGDPNVMTPPRDTGQVVPWEQKNSPGDISRSARAEYNAGRGFRR